MIHSYLHSAIILMTAYLDPGSGSLLIQLLITALVGVGFFLRSRWEKVKNFFGVKSSQIEKDDIEDGDFDV
jgi:hypothetical protein